MKKIILVIALLVICVAAQAALVGTTNLTSTLTSNYVSLAVDATQVGVNWDWTYTFTPTTVGNNVKCEMQSANVVIGVPAAGSVISAITATPGWVAFLTGGTVLEFNPVAPYFSAAPVWMKFTSTWGPSTGATAGVVANGDGFSGLTYAPVVPEPATFAGLAAFLPAGIMFLRKRKS